MSGNDIDTELMGRVAERMEETGRSLKSLSAQVATVSTNVSAIDTKIDSAHSRLKQIELKLDGNGGSKGLRTEFELLKKDIESTKKDVDTLETWKNGLSTAKVTELQQAQQEGKSNTRNTFMTIIAISIAIGSMFASCGPQWVKAWSSPPVAAGEKSNG